MTPCERAGVHLPGTGHSQTDCPTTMEDRFDTQQSEDAYQQLKREVASRGESTHE